MKEKPISRVVSVKVTYNLCIFAGECEVCGKPAPAPTDDQLVDRVIAASISDDRGLGYPGYSEGSLAIFPGEGDDEIGHYQPVGWTYSSAIGSVICDGCSAAREAAFNARRP